jgi:hypothetical protein
MMPDRPPGWPFGLAESPLQRGGVHGVASRSLLGVKQWWWDDVRNSFLEDDLPVVVVDGPVMPGT